MDNSATLQPSTGLSGFLARKPVILQLLKFAAIGALNTALDFIILNFVSKKFDVDAGTRLGLLNIISFTAATTQSYFWNRAWAFASASGSVFQNFYRLVLVGGLGFAAFVAVVLGAAWGANPIFFALIFVAFIISEVALWILFGLTSRQAGPHIGHQFITFLVVSIIGLLLNSLVVVVATHYLSPLLSGHGINADTIKNIAKALATGVSLVWNFIGYKLIVFKK